MQGTFDVETNTFIYSRIYPTNDNGVYWILYRQMPQSELYAVVKDFYRTSFLILSVAILIALGISVIIGGQIIRPLMELKRKVGDFAQGLPVNQPAQSYPLTEVAELHQSFYQMANQLDNERQQNRLLIKQLINAQEDERKRVAYDLHDGLIQQLVGAKMYLAMIKANCDGQLQEHIEQSEEALSQAIVDGRRMIEGLHPTILDDLGLVDAIAELAQQQAQRYDWDLNLQLESLPDTLDKTISVTVFRIVQEALNNVGKHADASQVGIHLSNGNSIRFVVEDDGQGMDLQNGNLHSGLGIGTMHERTMTLSGKFNIESEVGKGTRVMVELPCV
jgi:signal transduction histidine kinase